MYCKNCGKEIKENERYEHLEPDEFDIDLPMIICEHCYWELIDLKFDDEEEEEN